MCEPCEPTGTDDATAALRTCTACTRPLPRRCYSKTQWWREHRSCKACSAAGRPAHQMSGTTVRPNNWGFSNYVDELFSMKCFATIVGLGAFSSAKDVSESMASIHAARRHGGVSAETDGVLCLCVGDGCTPRTALLASFITKWRCVSIDPALKEGWAGPHGSVERLTGFGGTLDEFMATTPAAADLRVSQLVLLCVHSHARFVGPSALPSLLARYGRPATCLVTLPCCSGFRPERDIGRPADIRYDDECVFSDKRALEVWNFEEGASGAVASAAAAQLAPVEARSLPQHAQALIAARQAARQRKEWSRADAIRDELEEMGFLAEGSHRSVAGWRHLMGLASGGFVVYTVP